MAREFNNLPQWLRQKLNQQDLTPENFAFKAQMARTSIYYYLDGRVKPGTQAMARICRVLGVPLEEGLRQYSPSVIGRPKGSGGGVRSVTVRSR